MRKTLFVGVAFLLFSLACTAQQSKELSPAQISHIKKEVKAAGGGLIADLQKLDAEGSLQFYSDSPQWVMFNADGSRSSYQEARKAISDLVNSAIAYKWTTTRQDFIVLSDDTVICAWDGKDETLLKSGERVTYDPHAYTMVFKKTAGQWKIIYQQDSGNPVIGKPGKN